MTSTFASRRQALVAGLATAALGGLSARSALAADLEPRELSRIVAELVGAPVFSITPAPIPGLYEVIVKDNIIYIDASGKHLFDGQIFEVSSRASLTAQRRQEHERAITPVMDVGRLNLADAIKTVYGTEKPGRTFYTFEDPRCGFCKRLHKTLTGMTDVVVYTFPVSFLGPESRALNETIWCSGQRTQGWDDVMNDRAPAASGQTCDLTGLERNAELARTYRINGTPTLFTARGQRIEGAVAAPVLLAALDEAAR